MTTPFQPLPCDAGAGAAAALDVENGVLCDVDAAGNVVGTAIAVYTYDPETGAPTGAPTFVDPVTGAPYVPVGTLQPCREGCCPEPMLLCDVQADNTVVQFIRTVTGQADGGIATTDQLLDGTPYTPTGTVGSCTPAALCSPDPSLNLSATCAAPGTPTDARLVEFAPDAQHVDDVTADPLCSGGAWATQPLDINAPFPIDEPLATAATADPDVTFYGSAQLTGNGVIDPPGAGWLRLTNNSINQFGGIVFNTPFPATDDVTVEFDYATYGAGGIGGADGISVFLLDGTQPQPATLGQNGAALGYSSGTGGPGIAGGIVGVGLDEFGNYSGGLTGTGGDGGGAGVAVRGRGNSGALGDGAYPFITANHARGANIDGHPRTAPAHVRMTLLSSGGQVRITVDVDYQDGNGYIREIDGFDATAQVAPIPAQYRIGFAASTGLGTNFHELRNLRVTPAAVQNWRAFGFDADDVPACATNLSVRVCVDVESTVDTQDADDANADGEAYLLLVNEATGAIIDTDQATFIPNNLGEPDTLCVDALVGPGDLPNLRFYVGSERRDQAGSYGALWQNVAVTVLATGCPPQRIRTVPISAPCPLPVTIVGGGTGGGGDGGTTVFNAPATFEDAPICATVAGVPVPAFRREVRAADGSVEVTFLGADGLGITPESWTAGPCAVDAQGAALVLCDVTQVPVADGARSALDLTALATGPTAGAFGNGITFTVDQGTVGAAGTYLINGGTTQNWTFGEPAMLRFGVNNLNVGAECVTLPAGTVVESIHPNHTYNPATRVLCNGGAAAATDESIFTLDAATSLAITSNPGGGGQRGLVRLEAARTALVEVRTPFLRTICGTCGETPTVTDTTLDGLTPYAPAGVVGVCDAAAASAVDSDAELVELCDDNGVFVRRLLFDDAGAVVDSADLTLAGDPYVPVGPVTYGCTDPTATAQVYADCADIPTEQFTTGPNLLTNGDFERSTGQGASSVAGPGWISQYTACGPDLFLGPCGANNWSFFTTNAGQVMGSGPAPQIEALGARSFAVNVGPNVNLAIIEWPNVFLENGRTYELSADAAVNGLPFDIALKIGGSAAPGGLFPLSTPPVGNWGKTSASFTYTGATGFTSVGLYSNNTTPGGNDHAFDNFSLHTITQASAGTTTPRVYAGTQRAIIEQVVETAGCNDDRRDALLGAIANAIMPEEGAALDSTVQRLVGAGTITIAARARSVTVTVLAGTAAVNLGQGATSIPAGVSLTWAVDGPGETLTEAFAFTGVAGSDFIVNTTRQ